MSRMKEIQLVRTAWFVTDTAFLRNPNYHQAGDLPATLDYERMAALANGLVNALRAW